MPKKTKMMVAVKPGLRLSYMTRDLAVGEFFELEERLVPRLLAGGKAKVGRPRADVPPPPEPVAQKIAAAVAPPPASQEPPDERVALRAEYVTVVGRNPFLGWDADQLRERIAAARAAP